MLAKEKNEQRSLQEAELPPHPASPHGAPFLPSMQAARAPVLLSPSLPLSPLSSELPMASHGAPTPAMAARPWRALTKAVFLHGITKTDVHDLPLAIPIFNFIRNEL
jgi:hypothetical protein